MPTITLDDIAYRYEKRDIFEHLNAQWGDKTGVVGANGAGKTTLLKIIARELVAQSGSVRFAGRTDYRAMTLFDDKILFDHLTIASHFEWLCCAYQKDASWLDRKRSTFAIDDYWNRCPHALSAGQRHWCATALALSVQADIFLFDEPLCTLDDEHKKLWFSIVDDLNVAVVATDQCHHRDRWHAPWHCVSI